MPPGRRVSEKRCVLALAPPKSCSRSSSDSVAKVSSAIPSPPLRASQRPLARWILADERGVDHRLEGQRQEHRDQRNDDAPAPAQQRPRAVRRDEHHDGRERRRDQHRRKVERRRLGERDADPRRRRECRDPGEKQPLHQPRFPWQESAALDKRRSSRGVKRRGAPPR
jgi:hypothetical protein